MKKQITQKQAKEKYGINMSHLPEYNKFYLLDNGNVVDICGDIRFLAKPTKRKSGVSKKTECAIHIIEEVVEPLMAEIALSKTPRKVLEQGMEGEEYYSKMEDKIISILKTYL